MRFFHGALIAMAIMIPLWVLGVYAYLLFGDL